MSYTRIWRKVLVSDALVHLAVDQSAYRNTPLAYQKTTLCRDLHVPFVSEMYAAPQFVTCRECIRMYLESLDRDVVRLLGVSATGVHGCYAVAADLCRDRQQYDLANELDFGHELQELQALPIPEPEAIRG